MSNERFRESGISETKLHPPADGEKQTFQYEEVHFGDVLGSWNNGVQLDLRVKLAVDFLKAGMLARPAELLTVVTGIGDVGTPDQFSRRVAAFALDLASELLNKGAENGWVKSLPETGELSGAQRHHLERLTRAQMFPQINGQRLAEDEGAPAVQRVSLAGLPRGN